ncbi:vir protein [Legionella quinlivanii]|uniref:Vir protein n=2 Tax=Legionella quinlivanii TaxID=45073 RepID=A0A0W0XTD7_9GAMM|nr:vir protein [Legionella quinlivanii]SEG37153.1 type IV secretion system protein VirB2 [Legionella quinlivanii DSM 21216]STY10110.1 LvrB2 [Legionella quinlivanii]
MRKLHRFKQLAKARYLALCSALLPVPCFAKSIETVINGAVNYLQGDLVRSVAVAIIVTLGYMCFKLQKFPKEYFVYFLVGLGLVFGASEIYGVVERG